MFVAVIWSALAAGGSGADRVVLAGIGASGFVLGWATSAHVTRLTALPLWVGSLALPPLALAALGWLVVVLTSESSNEFGDALGFVLLTTPIWLLVAVPWALWTARSERPSIW